MALLDITPIIDSAVQYNAIQTLLLGGQDLDEYLCTLLSSDPQFLQEYGEPINVDFAREIKEMDICELIDEDDDLDERPERVEVEYNEKKVSIIRIHSRNRTLVLIRHVTCAV